MFIFLFTWVTKLFKMTQIKLPNFIAWQLCCCKNETDSELSSIKAKLIHLCYFLNISITKASQKTNKLKNFIHQVLFFWSRTVYSSSALIEKQQN